MASVGSQNYYAAIKDFQQARRRAALEQIMAQLTGKSADLLSYEEVRQKLKLTSRGTRQLKEIPLDAIVGSVGRYTDFTRSFLPKQDSAEGRWAGVRRAVADLGGLPPIDVYQIGDVYFVRDGNHRVSVARQLGAPSIEAYVTELRSKVPLSPDVQPDELIQKAEYAEFLEHTKLDKLRPEADLSVTAPGRYREIEEHIQVHRYYMGLEQKRDVAYKEAAAHWYDAVYLPVVQTIRERSVLRDFPGRTEADLYLWISKHRAALEQRLEQPIEPGAAAADLAAQASPRPERFVARVSEKVLDAVTPDELESGPETGEWRTQHLATRRDERLFADVLVPVNGAEAGWHALEQALEVARREGSRLHGLHVVPSEAQIDGAAAQAVRDEFDRRCEAAGVPGKLALVAGKVSRQVCERSRWVDLAVLNLAYPPSPQPLARLSSGFRTVIRRCPRPVLAVPGLVSPLSRALLAYDGSPKAEEALFVATYLAGRWQMPLLVVTVIENDHVTPETLTRARHYLETHGVQANFVQGQKNKPVAEIILKAAEKHGSDLIVMGGYGRSPVVEVVLGSTVDRVLRSARQPLLICR